MVTHPAINLVQPGLTSVLKGNALTASATRAPLRHPCSPSATRARADCTHDKAWLIPHYKEQGFALTFRSLPLFFLFLLFGCSFISTKEHASTAERVVQQLKLLQEKEKRKKENMLAGFLVVDVKTGDNLPADTQLISCASNSGSVGVFRLCYHGRRQSERPSPTKTKRNNSCLGVLWLNKTRGRLRESWITYLVHK